MLRKEGKINVFYHNSCPLALPVFILHTDTIRSCWQQQDQLNAVLCIFGQLVNSNLSNTDFETIVTSSDDSIKSTDKLVSWRLNHFWT